VKNEAHTKAEQGGAVYAITLDIPKIMSDSPTQMVADNPGI
jgi:hypothetical protein